MFQSKFYRTVHLDLTFNLKSTPVRNITFSSLVAGLPFHHRTFPLYFFRWQQYHPVNWNNSLDFVYHLCCPWQQKDTKSMRDICYIPWFVFKRRFHKADTQAKSLWKSDKVGHNLYVSCICWSMLHCICYARNTSSL